MNNFNEKPAQLEIKKTVFSQMIRNRRIQLFISNSRQRNGKYCNICGFRVRGKNHFEGSHHYDSPGAVEARKMAAAK